MNAILELNVYAFYSWRESLLNGKNPNKSIKANPKWGPDGGKRFILTPGSGKLTRKTGRSLLDWTLFISPDFRSVIGFHWEQYPYLSSDFKCNQYQLANYWLVDSSLGVLNVNWYFIMTNRPPQTPLVPLLLGFLPPWLPPLFWSFLIECLWIVIFNGKIWNSSIFTKSTDGPCVIKLVSQRTIIIRYVETPLPHQFTDHIWLHLLARTFIE